MWFARKETPVELAEPKMITYTLVASHTRLERAHMLARLAFHDFATDRLGMTERAAFRIADALDKYDQVDAEARNARPLPGTGLG